MGSKKIGEIRAKMNPKLIPPAIVPIFRPAEGVGWEQFGTAIFISIGPIPFLLTAGHVLDDAINSMIFTKTGDQMLRIPVNSFTSIGGKGLRAKDKLDYGWLLLAKTTALQLGTNFSSYQISSQLFNDYSRPGNIYAFAGYPSAVNHNSDAENKRLNALVLLGPPLDKAKLDSFGLNPSLHIAGAYPNDASDRGAREAATILEKAPHPEGMSGGSVWSMAMIGNQIVKSTLAGIIIEYRKVSQVHILVASRIEFALAALAHEYPWLAFYIPRFVDHELEYRNIFSGEVPEENPVVIHGPDDSLHSKSK